MELEKEQHRISNGDVSTEPIEDTDGLINPEDFSIQNSKGLEDREESDLKSDVPEDINIDELKDKFTEDFSPLTDEDRANLSHKLTTNDGELGLSEKIGEKEKIFRKGTIKYGRFLDDRVNYGNQDWDSMPIGMHGAYRRMEDELAKTSGYEYYYVDKDGAITILNNPSTKEKVNARLKHLLSSNKNERVGYRNRCSKE